MSVYIIIGVIALLVLLLLFYVIVTYNSLIKHNNAVKEAFATMDVYLKKRWDLIPNLVETVKGYAAHEKETLEKVISLRNCAYDGLSPEDKISANTELSKGISKILALAESYPDLKANTNFMNLSNQLTHLEDEIANSRKYYNAVVRNYNNKIQMFPCNLIAGLLGYTPKDMFEIESAQRENIKVEF